MNALPVLKTQIIIRGATELLIPLLEARVDTEEIPVNARRRLQQREEQIAEASEELLSEAFDKSPNPSGETELELLNTTTTTVEAVGTPYGVVYEHDDKLWINPSKDLTKLYHEESRTFQFSDVVDIAT